MENDNKATIATFDIWHPIDGEIWVHIAQETDTKDLIRKYYTDGKLVATKEINKDGTIKS